MSKKFFGFLSTISLPFIATFSCQMNSERKIDEFNNENNLSQNVFKLNSNNLWKPEDLKSKKHVFEIKDESSFKDEILSRVLFENKKEEITNGWTSFSKQFSKLFEKSSLEKYHIIYYSNYDSVLPLDTVKVSNNKVEINYSSYNINTKAILSSQYIILLEKTKISSIEKIEVNNFNTKESDASYKKEISSIKSIIYFTN
ncbi:hypothetical protein [Mycoplasma procyoni]|uniref:hypothetical protein n=1 Tax=Mycoplasma procyoni TaxID=568784 RepID=UPI00197C1DDB|nr:hypothetical protein [Mycoplasma procyoni]MBN3534920.1 hypothetical protein [Mycoplasma procyoni]